MTDEPRSLEDVVERARAQAGLRDHRGSFDSDCEAPDSWGSPRAEWWPFIKLAVIWGDACPLWTLDDWMGKTL